MTLSEFLKEHEHSFITLGVVLMATLLGYGVLGFVFMAGIWLGREHSQAEYRYMSMHKINRSELKWNNALDFDVWDRHSLLSNLMLPIFIGILTVIIGVNVC